jgi:hypothetical protein
VTTHLADCPPDINAVSFSTHLNPGSFDFGWDRPTSLDVLATRRQGTVHERRMIYLRNSTVQVAGAVCLGIPLGLTLGLIPSLLISGNVLWHMTCPLFFAFIGVPICGFTLDTRSQNYIKNHPLNKSVTVPEFETFWGAVKTLFIAPKTLAVGNIKALLKEIDPTEKQLSVWAAAPACQTYCRRCLSSPVPFLLQADVDKLDALRDESTQRTLAAAEWERRANVGQRFEAQVQAFNGSPEPTHTP